MCIDSTDIGMSDHFLVCWVEQQRIIGNRSVQLEGGVLISLVMMLLEKSIVKHYRQRLRPFQRADGMKGVLKEWENIVNSVARDTVGEKVIVCGRSVRWWDDEIKAKIEQRRQLYKGPFTLALGTGSNAHQMRIRCIHT